MADVPVPPGYPGAPERTVDGEPPAPRFHHDVLHGFEVPLDQVDVQRMEAKRRLADEARRLVEAVMLYDTAEVDVETTDDLIRRLGEVADALAEQPDLRAYGSVALGPPVASALDQRSPISGVANPIAPPMDIVFDGDKTRATATYGPAYEGPPFHVHGGWVIAAFDELLGVAQVAGNAPGMTGTLTIRLTKPTPIGKRVDYVGWVDRVDGRKTFAKGEARIDGEVVAEAEGIFIAPRNWVAAMEDGSP